MLDLVEFVEKLKNVQQDEVVVLRDVNRFPVYNQDFVSPNLVLSICKSGFAKTLYDLNEATFGKNNLAVLLPNHIICPIESSDDYDITMLVMSPKFVEELKLRTLSHDHHKYHLTPNTLLTDEQTEILLKVIDTIDVIATSPITTMPNKHNMMIQQVDIFFEVLNSFRYEQDRMRHNISRSNKLFNDFCNLLAIHFRESREVSFYAAKLHLTSRYFSRMIYDSVGMLASEWIEQYVAINAKQILSSRDDLSIQQIAYQLGFTEASAFCRFFKRATGVTPKDFRKNREIEN